MEVQEHAVASSAVQPSPPSKQPSSFRGKVSPLQRRASAKLAKPPTRNSLQDVTGSAFPPRSPRATPQLVDVKEWAAEDRSGDKTAWAPEVLGFPSPRAQGAPSREVGGGAEQQQQVQRGVIGSPRSEQVHFLQNQWQDISLVKEVEAPTTEEERMKEANPMFFPGRRAAPSLEFVENPRYPTRTALLEARRRRLRPDVSFDVDGDGSVGVEDYLLASFMDDDKNGFLTAEEMVQASKVKDYFDTECIKISSAGIKSNRNKLNRELRSSLLFVMGDAPGLTSQVKKKKKKKKRKNSESSRSMEKY